jgi:hypothetical protein
MAYRYPSVLPGGGCSAGACSSNSRPCTPNKRPVRLDWLSVSNNSATGTPGTLANSASGTVNYAYTGLVSPGYTSLTTLPAAPTTWLNTILLEVGKTYNITTVVGVFDDNTGGDTSLTDATLTLRTNNINDTSTSTIYGVGVRASIDTTIALGVGELRNVRLILTGQWTIQVTDANKYINFTVLNEGGTVFTIITGSLQITQLSA